MAPRAGASKAEPPADAQQVGGELFTDVRRDWAPWNRYRVHHRECHEARQETERSCSYPLLSAPPHSPASSSRSLARRCGGGAGPFPLPSPRDLSSIWRPACVRKTSPLTRFLKTPRLSAVVPVTLRVGIYRK